MINKNCSTKERIFTEVSGAEALNGDFVCKKCHRFYAHSPSHLCGIHIPGADSVEEKPISGTVNKGGRHNVCFDCIPEVTSTEEARQFISHEILNHSS